MAKKGQALQLQSEVNTDEEWQQLLEKDGLLVVDIYSEWCGPCVGMTGNLRKLKLEIGGDLLQLAIAKSDTITCLERFRNKSEPTWMFISKGKQVNLMFGADSPKLMNMIIQELEKEKESQAQGAPIHRGASISEMSSQERERFDRINAVKKQAMQQELEIKNKLIMEHRVTQAKAILEHLSQNGIILVLPKAVPKWQEVFHDSLAESPLSIVRKEKEKLTREQIENMLIFSDFTFPEETMQVLETEQSLALFLKTSNEDPNETIDDQILKFIYGMSKQPPGDETSLAWQLRMEAEPPDEHPKLSIAQSAAIILEAHYEGVGSKQVIESAIEAKRSQLTSAGSGEIIREDEERPLEPIIGLWAPPNAFSKAYALKVLFPGMTNSMIVPEPEPTPPFVAVVYDAIKRREFKQLLETYPEAVMRYGFFTDDDPRLTKLIAKTIPKFEKKLTEAPTYTEKLVIQLSKKKSEAVLAFAQLGPVRMSVNPDEGKHECKLFFPEDYDEPEEEEVVEEEVKKKKKKKKRVEGDQQPEEVRSDETLTDSVSEVLAQEGEEAAEGGSAVVEEGEGAIEGAEVAEGGEHVEVESVKGDVIEVVEAQVIPEGVIEKPAESPAEAPVDVPAEGPLGGPVEGHVESPVEGPVENPVESPVTGPIEGPTEAAGEGEDKATSPIAQEEG